MKHTHHFARSVATITARSPSGQTVQLPVIPGILKHPSIEQLPALLENPRVVRTYTTLALQKASWQVLKQFPKDWLTEGIPEAQLPDARKRALLFLLG